MSLIKAFKGLRPADDYVQQVVAPPYDVIDFAEAQALAQDRPWSFLHISRPEIDCPAGTDPYDESVYQQGKKNLDRMIEQGILKQDEQPAYYVYRLTMGDHVQTGLVATASVVAYDQGRIKKHELTRPVKENDRVKNIDTLNAQTGPVFLVYPAQTDIDQILAEQAQSEPDMQAELNGVIHQIWRIDQPDIMAALSQAFEQLPALYVADGHHRSAAASRVAAARRATDPHPTGEKAYDYFLSVIFPHDQMQILDYNRVIKDLNGLSREQFLDRLTAFQWQKENQAVKPSQNGEYGLYLSGQWYRLRIRPDLIPDHPVDRLDVSLLQNHLIAPVLGIDDPRRDDRIDFVGGIRGLSELEKRVDQNNWALAFSLYPTSIQDLMAVADAGQVMPPKSTWFEPKLADGLVSHRLD